MGLGQVWEGKKEHPPLLQLDAYDILTFVEKVFKNFLSMQGST